MLHRPRQGRARLRREVKRLDVTRGVLAGQVDQQRTELTKRQQTIDAQAQQIATRDQQLATKDQELGAERTRVTAAKSALTRYFAAVPGSPEAVQAARDAQSALNGGGGGARP